MGNEAKFLPGTGRWQAKPDGGARLGDANSLTIVRCVDRPLHHFVVPLPVPGRN
jgi:hypothetical protein